MTSLIYLYLYNRRQRSTSGIFRPGVQGAPIFSISSSSRFRSLSSKVSILWRRFLNNSRAIWYSRLWVPVAPVVDQKPLLARLIRLRSDGRVGSKRLEMLLSPSRTTAISRSSRWSALVRVISGSLASGVSTSTCFTCFKRTSVS